MSKSKSERNVEPAEPKLSQMQMVRLALQACGMDAKPQDIHKYILEQFREDLPTNLISNYKSQIRRQSGTGGRRNLPIEDLESIRTLVRRLGAEQLKRLVDVLS